MLDNVREVAGRDSDTFSPRQSGSSRASLPCLLERDAFIASLCADLEMATAGAGRCVLVSGEAGAGKSALLRHFSDLVSARADVLWGSCDPLSSPRPLGPLADVAEQLGGLLSRQGGAAVVIDYGYSGGEQGETLQAVRGHKYSYVLDHPGEQDLTAQRNALLALGVEEKQIFADHGLTGANRVRPGLREAMAACRAGDTLVVTKLDRLARSLSDARGIADELTS